MRGYHFSSAKTEIVNQIIFNQNNILGQKNFLFHDFLQKCKKGKKHINNT